MDSENFLMEELQSLQRKLGKKQSFEEAVFSIQSLARDHYASSSPSLRQSIYSTVCRVATVLQTRYTAPGFWLAGLRLFVIAEGMVSEKSQKEHLKKCIARAREHLHDVENEVPAPRQPDSRYLFEGHLTVQPEPAPPAWLVAQNLLTTLAVAQDLASPSGGQDENRNATETSGRAEVPESVRELLNNMQEMGGFLDLENIIEASMQEIGAGPQRPLPASREVVANLPVVIVTEEVIARLGSATECAVCRENLVVNDKMQEFTCKHLFHPPCLKPWLGEHNSCPIYHAYESRKEREKEEEEERKGAANALCGGEFMSFKVILCYYFIPIGKDVNQLQVSWQSSGRSRAFFDAHDPRCSNAYASKTRREKIVVLVTSSKKKKFVSNDNNLHYSEQILRVCRSFYVALMLSRLVQIEILLGKTENFYELMTAVTMERCIK